MQSEGGEDQGESDPRSVDGGSRSNHIWFADHGSAVSVFAFCFLLQLIDYRLSFTTAFTGTDAFPRNIDPEPDLPHWVPLAEVD